MTTTACDIENCKTCGTETVYADKNGECRPCATFSHNLRLMAAGVSRDKATGRYIQIGAKK